MQCSNYVSSGDKDFTEELPEKVLVYPFKSTRNTKLSEVKWSFPKPFFRLSRNAIYTVTQRSFRFP